MKILLIILTLAMLAGCGGGNTQRSQEQPQGVTRDGTPTMPAPKLPNPSLPKV